MIDLAPAIQVGVSTPKVGSISIDKNTIPPKSLPFNRISLQSNHPAFSYTSTISRLADKLFKMQYHNASQLLIYTPRKTQGNPARNNIANSAFTIQTKKHPNGCFRLNTWSCVWRCKDLCIPRLEPMLPRKLEASRLCNDTSTASM